MNATGSIVLASLLAILAPFPSLAGGAATRSALHNHFLDRPNVARTLSPTHEHLGSTHLEYGDRHPFRRHLQSYNEMDLEYDARDAANDYNILRVRFIVEPLLSQKGREFDEAIDYIVSEILPAVYETWARHLSVFPVQGSIPISEQDCFGGFEGRIPQSILQNGVDDADLVILVHGQDTIAFSEGTDVNFCSGTNLAVAAACTLDQYDRPVLGFINFCLGNLEEISTRRTLLLNSVVEPLVSDQGEEEASPLIAFLGATKFIERRFLASILDSTLFSDQLTFLFCFRYSRHS
jgi:hypothetical protein